ncbi:DUF4199 domain-containing protein [Aquimarina sp. AD10]|uniref:DUF4199 domain-containing protein n=1 Tax=Aquimarina sp. AD10 TaxID=1714849 RepID=UPI000E514AE6|nr:DUF4199 domain-containing protein [Aquimarina sp. AD10]AXT60180.1 DUF4199 domain-containing protein [Aquimarina sp. AD10]RKN00027.1 DUF4199 family protein [Aquimarina sp. AD10]
MNETSIPVKKHILKYGLILGVTSIFYGLILFLTKNYTQQNWVNTAITALILVLIVVYGIYKYKSANEGFIKLIEALKVGIGIAVIGGIISIISHILITSAIEPDIITQTIDIQKNEMIKRNPNLSQEEVDKSIALIEKFNSPSITAIFALIWNLFAGFLISLISGAIMQKQRNPF